MGPDSLPSIRELDGRVTDGAQARLLWHEGDHRFWVSVIDTGSGHAFRLAVGADERSLDVFHPRSCTPRTTGSRQPTVPRSWLRSGRRPERRGIRPSRRPDA